MSAMRLMTKSEFYAELTKNGFEIGERVTQNNTLWLHKETGKSFTIPHDAEDGIPDCILDKYLAAVGRLYVDNNGEDCVDKKYGVNPAKPSPVKLEIAKG